MYFHQQKNSILPQTQKEGVASQSSSSPSPWSIKGMGSKKYMKLLATFVALHTVYVYTVNPNQRRAEAENSTSGFDQMNSSVPLELIQAMQAAKSDSENLNSPTGALGSSISPRDLLMENDQDNPHTQGGFPADTEFLDSHMKDNDRDRDSMLSSMGDVSTRELPKDNKKFSMLALKSEEENEDEEMKYPSMEGLTVGDPKGGNSREMMRGFVGSQEEERREEQNEEIDEEDNQQNEDSHTFMHLFKSNSPEVEDDRDADRANNRAHAKARRDEEKDAERDAEHDEELLTKDSEQQDRAPIYDISTLQHPNAPTAPRTSPRSLNFDQSYPEREASSNEDEMPAYSDVDQDQREEQGDEEDRLQPPMPTYPERTPPNREEEVPSFSERDEDRREGQGGEGDRFQPPMPTEKDRSDPFDLRNLNLDPNDLQNMDTETLNKILEANNINPDVLPKFDASGFQAEMRSSTSASGLPSVDSCTKAPWIPAPKRVPIRPTMNASYPGSGARLSWKLIRAITGHMTSDDAVDEGDLAKQGLVISIKTHYPAHGSNDELFKPFASIDRSVLVLRNPVNAIPSFLSYLYERSNGLENHSTRAPPEYWIEWRDKNFESALFSWVEHTLFWLEHNTKGNLLVIAYEHLINKETGPEDLARIGNFLAESSGIELPQTPQAIPCVWDHVVNSRGAEQPQSHRSGGPKHFAYTDRQIEMTITYLSSLKKMYPEIGAIMDEYVVDTLAIQAYGRSNMASQF
uniref:Sulfotransferase domain-containing protein n=1 Tax=Chaetoceros debilis TaxID=122233 RepID=A0A7S3QBM5_9STRA